MNAAIAGSGDNASNAGIAVSEPSLARHWFRALNSKASKLGVRAEESTAKCLLRAGNLIPAMAAFPALLLLLL